MQITTKNINNKQLFITYLQIFIYTLILMYIQKQVTGYIANAFRDYNYIKFINSYKKYEDKS